MGILLNGVNEVSNNRQIKIRYDITTFINKTTA